MCESQGISLTCIFWEVQVQIHSTVRHKILLINQQSLKHDVKTQISDGENIFSSLTKITFYI